MNKKQSLIKFMAMSKIIGIIIFAFVIIVSIFVMYEMHISQNYDALPQLIISIFGFASVYTGFYLTMAKVEHIEEEKTKREKELLLLKNSFANWFVSNWLPIPLILKNSFPYFFSKFIISFLNSFA